MDKLLIGSANHLESAGGLRRLDYLMLNLPYTCNYQCTKCCNASYGSSGDAAEQHLSFDEVQKLITEAKDLRMRVLVIAGEGEPLLNPKIDEIVVAAHTNGLIPYIFTNGSILEYGTAGFLKRQGASLIVNIDSLKPRLYRKLTGGKGNYAQIHRNLGDVRHIFSDTYSKTADYALRRIAINMVASESNAAEIESIREFCGDDFVFVCNTPMSKGRAKDNPEFRHVKTNPNTIPLGTTSDNSWCAYMRNGISVGARGEILTCAYALESAGLMGNVRKGGLIRFVERANTEVDKFFEQHGHARCIVRHSSYSQFIDRLRQLA